MTRVRSLGRAFYRDTSPPPVGIGRQCRTTLKFLNEICTTTKNKSLEYSLEPYNISAYHKVLLVEKKYFYLFISFKEEAMPIVRWNWGQQQNTDSGCIWFFFFVSLSFVQTKTSFFHGNCLSVFIYRYFNVRFIRPLKKNYIRLYSLYSVQGRKITLARNTW